MTSIFLVYFTHSSVPFKCETISVLGIDHCTPLCATICNFFCGAAHEHGKKTAQSTLVYSIEHDFKGEGFTLKYDSSV